MLFDGSTIRDSDMNGVTMRGVGIEDTSIDGEFKNLVLNGVDVAPLVEAELDRRDPDRPKFRPTTPDGFREAWDVNERRWSATLDRARRLPAERLHESVGGEWSFVQTLRHLAFASESWVGRAVLGDPYPWHPWSLAWDTSATWASRRTVTPGRRSTRRWRSGRTRWDSYAAWWTTCDEAELGRETDPCVGPGWPLEGATFSVRDCLLTVLNEEWHHRVYAERDLAVLEAGD